VGRSIQDRRADLSRDNSLLRRADLSRGISCLRRADLSRDNSLLRRADLSRNISLSRSQFRQTHGRNREQLSELQTKIPDPLAEDLPEFLPTSAARTPTIWVLFAIFIREHRLEGSPMQIQVKHVRTGEGLCRHGGDKQFIDGLSPQHANGRFAGGGGWMSGNDQAHMRSCRHQGNIRTIEEGAAGSTLGMGGLLIGRLAQTSLNGRQIEQAIVFTAHDDPHPTATAR
jgi:hypothetical protein